jgi:hypothetical protein
MDRVTQGCPATGSSRAIIIIIIIIITDGTSKFGV